MKKLINRPDRYVDEAPGGLCASLAGMVVSTIARAM
jgi:hypothetical protein